jgi:hypothetical protein
MFRKSFVDCRPRASFEGSANHLCSRRSLSALRYLSAWQQDLYESQDARSVWNSMDSEGAGRRRPERSSSLELHVHRWGGEHIETDHLGLRGEDSNEPRRE